MRVTRHDSARVPRSLFNQGVTELVQPIHYVEDAIALIEATHGSALVDTATPSVHLAADILAYPGEQMGLNLQQEASPQGVDRKRRRFHPTQLDQGLEDHLRDYWRQNSLLRQHDCMSQIDLIELAHLTLLAGQPGNVMVFDQSVGRRAAEAGFGQ